MNNQFTDETTRKTHVSSRTLCALSRDRGGRPWASSMAVIPNDQMSALAS